MKSLGFIMPVTCVAASSWARLEEQCIMCPLNSCSMPSSNMESPVSTVSTGTQAFEYAVEMKPWLQNPDIKHQTRAHLPSFIDVDMAWACYAQTSPSCGSDITQPFPASRIESLNVCPQQGQTWHGSTTGTASRILFLTLCTRGKILHL